MGFRVPERDIGPEIAFPGDAQLVETDVESVSGISRLTWVFVISEGMQMWSVFIIDQRSPLNSPRRRPPQAPNAKNTVSSGSST